MTALLSAHPRASIFVAVWTIASIVSAGIYVDFVLEHGWPFEAGTLLLLLLAGLSIALAAVTTIWLYVHGRRRAALFATIWAIASVVLLGASAEIAARSGEGPSGIEVLPALLVGLLPAAGITGVTMIVDEWQPPARPPLPSSIELLPGDQVAHARAAGRCAYCQRRGGWLSLYTWSHCPACGALVCRSCFEQNSITWRSGPEDEARIYTCRACGDTNAGGTGGIS